MLKNIKLRTEAEPTGRLLPAPYTDFSVAEDGEEYQSEWSAEGEDLVTGEAVRVFWIQSQIKGEELDPDRLDWENTVDRVEYL